MNLRQRNILVRSIFAVAAGCAAWLIFGFAALSFSFPQPERVRVVRDVRPLGGGPARDLTRIIPATPGRIDLSEGLEWVFDSDQRWALIGAPLAFIVGCYLRAGEN